MPSSPLFRLGANLTSATTVRSGRSIVQVRGTSAAVRPTSRVLIETMARARAATGVEMEALTAASVATLTVYDMCKAASKDIVIGPIRLLVPAGCATKEMQMKECHVAT